MSVFLEALKTATQKLFYGPGEQRHELAIDPELLARFAQAQTKFGSQPKKAKKGAAK